MQFSIFELGTIVHYVSEDKYWCPISMENTITLAENSKKKSQLNIKEHILVRNYRGTLGVFCTIGFCPCRFFCWSLKTKAVSCDNAQITLGETFISKCDINFFEITLPSHSCLHGNFFIIVRGLFLVFICSDDDIYSLYWFFSIN